MSDEPSNRPSDQTAEGLAPTRSHGRLSARATSRPRDLFDDARAVRGAWLARVITLFPQAFPGVLEQSLTGRAMDLGLWRLETYDLRRFGIGKHRTVDDTPAGGGAGMVLRADVVDAALTEASAGANPDRARWPVIYLSPRGKQFDQAMARRFSGCEGLTMLCGRFEGVDQRVLDHHAVEEVSLGDFVLTGGEIAAQAVLDATVRLLPGVVGNAQSLEDESHSNGLLEHPHYTRPPVWEGHEIPPVLLSGDHARIARWRRDQSEALTAARRPDLWPRPKS